jgi:lipopolysaccharide/colanic/teichoic acid biosynthesis glycosyltransferase
LTIPFSAAAPVNFTDANFSKLRTDGMRESNRQSRESSPRDGADSSFALSSFNGWYFCCRSLLERSGALILLVLSAPLLGLVWLVARAISSGPAFVGQVRVGRGGRVFRMYRVRTARLGAGQFPPVHGRFGHGRFGHGRFGRWIARSQLDALPLLWNVVKGDLSLIGPRAGRPELDAVFAGCIGHYRDRLLVKPGILGLAQLCLPADTDLESVERRLALDLHYIRHAGPRLDLMILARSLFGWLMNRGTPLRWVVARQPDILFGQRIRSARGDY